MRLPYFPYLSFRFCSGGRYLALLLIPVLFVFFAAALPAEAARASKKAPEASAESGKKRTKGKKQQKPLKVVRTSALKSTPPIRYVNKQGVTEVEVTPAISRANLNGSREVVINRRDDNTPTITTVTAAEGKRPEIIVDVNRQRLDLVLNGRRLASYPVSTSRFGLGDKYHSYKTPIGQFEVDGKIGGSLPLGAVLKKGRFTGEILQPNAPGRDPIVTRMIRLRGLERQNANSYGRGIFIHGTPDEKRIGKPVSWGCIRMRSSDVVELYSRIGNGTRVTIRATGDGSPERRSWFANLFGGDRPDDT